MRKTVVIGFLGTTLDNTGKGPKRWERWRPTVSICQHEDFLVDRLHLLYQKEHASLLTRTCRDIRAISPETEIVPHLISLKNPWDFEEVYGLLHDFAKTSEFSEDEDYLVHISTGSHVAQICLYLLTETRYFPARLLQSGPGRGRVPSPEGSVSIIDLDLSKYDRIASRFHKEWQDGISFLKSGIATKNKPFNQLIEQIERVAGNSVDPILLAGPTGAGKSRLARRIYELKKSRKKIEGEFVEVNCATLRGENAMSALFGHSKGAFTGAISARPGLLKRADKGLLFLDEIGELGSDEQAMLLRAIEQKSFLPVGQDKEVCSDFQLICGSNRDLHKECHTGRFRGDLLARINLWTFVLPGLRQRLEDIEPNFEYELDRFAERTGRRVSINTEARRLFFDFALSPRAKWSANFRDLGAAVTRMATLAPNGRITAEVVRQEVARLASQWGDLGEMAVENEREILPEILSADALQKLDLFDRLALERVVGVCRVAGSMAEAGRLLFNNSRLRKKVPNDSDRLRKYLAKFDLDWQKVSKR